MELKAKSTNRLLVLNYHDFSDQTFPSSSFTITKNQFVRQIEMVDELKIPICNPLKLIYNKELQPFSLLFTFDDGYISHYEFILPILDKYKIKALFFPILGNWDSPGYLSIPQLKKINDSGHLIGNHTIHHLDFTKLNKKQIKKEITESEKFIQENTPFIHPEWMALPYGKWNNKIRDSAVLSGKIVFTTLRKINHMPSSVIHRFNVKNNLSEKSFRKLVCGDFLALKKWSVLSTLKSRFDF